MSGTVPRMTDTEQIAYLQKAVRELKAKLSETSQIANLYTWLHDKEVLLATPEGFKHLKGDDLTIYIRNEMAKDWGIDLANFSKIRSNNGGNP